MNPEVPIPHDQVRPPINRIVVIKFCPLCGSSKGYTDAGKVDGMQMYQCRECKGVYPKEAT